MGWYVTQTNPHQTAGTWILTRCRGLATLPDVVSEPDPEMTGIDPEAFDLRLGPHTPRLPFERRVHDAAAARAALVALVKQARARLAEAC